MDFEIFNTKLKEVDTLVIFHRRNDQEHHRKSRDEMSKSIHGAFGGVVLSVSVGGNVPGPDLLAWIAAYTIAIDERNFITAPMVGRQVTGNESTNGPRSAS